MQPGRSAGGRGGSGGRSIGNALGSGVVAGIAAYAAAAADAAADVVNIAISAAFGAANANSPSRKTMYLGEMMGKGIEVGMLGSLRDITAAAERMVVIPSLSPVTVGWQADAAPSLGGGGTGGFAPLPTRSTSHERPITITISPVIHVAGNVRADHDRALMVAEKINDGIVEGVRQVKRSLGVV